MLKRAPAQTSEARHQNVEVSASAPSSPKIRTLSEARAYADLPSVYADQIVDVIYGTSTTKLVFGLETGEGVVVKNVAILPTSALLNAAMTIVENLSNPAMVEETSKRFLHILNVMRTRPVATGRKYEPVEVEKGSKVVEADKSLKSPRGQKK
jgi:hypothetical protein